MHQPSSGGRDSAPQPLLADRAAAAFERFLHIEAASGIVLLLAAAAALILANSTVGDAYQALWHSPGYIGLGTTGVSLPLHFWINDGLMTIFFLVVGLEIRREMQDGALASLRQAALPLFAAVGGVVVPALLFVLINAQPPARSGWAVPTATDIAFAVGVLALLGRSIPSGVRVILLALAIVDDLIAGIVIALFYSGGLDLLGLPIIAAGLLLVFGLRKAGVLSPWSYVLPGFVVWSGMLVTGVHPTLAGVMLGLLTPVRSDPRRGSSAAMPAPAERLQNVLHPWVAYAVMPLFALANAGVALRADSLSAGSALSVASGVAIALLLGKPLGVVGAVWCATRAGWCRLPPGVNWRGMWLVGLLAGIGFTMSLFIAMLAFTDESLLDAAKLGVLAGSLLSCLLGLAWGWLTVRSRDVLESPKLARQGQQR
jgi:NhaA family Na+:H+ antiporter